jgi:secondary thiamine-phosphate synthase enzyme
MGPLYSTIMTVVHTELQFATTGHGNIIDLSDEIGRWLRAVGAEEGLLTAFVPGSTGAITTLEYEPGCIADLCEALERVAPSDRGYHHDRRWGDGNGFSHLRAALLGPSLTVPVAGGRAILGTWQQPVLVECDLRGRQRRVVLSFVGEAAGSA